MLRLIAERIITLKMAAGVKRYMASASWMLAEQLLRIISGLLVGVWVARYLGPAQFGLFSYVLAFSAIFSGVAKLGLDGILVRELVNESRHLDTYLGTAFWLKFLGGLAMMGMVAVILLFIGTDPIVKLYIGIVSLGFVFQSFEVVEFYFQSQVQARIVSICKSLQLVVSSLVKLYLVFIGADLVWFVCITVFDAVGLAISYFIAYRLVRFPTFLVRFDLAVAARLLNDSWPLIFSSFFAMIYLRIDQLMIKEVLGEHEVGIYAAAVRLSEAFYFLPVLITASIFPAILNARKLGLEIYNYRLQVMYSVLAWIAVCIALLFYFFGERGLVYLFGEAYKEAGDVLIVHVWGGVFVFISAGFGRYLMAENLAIVNMYRVVLGALLNVVLNLFMIERYGVVGAAYSTVLSLFFVNYVFDIFTPKLYMQLRLKILALVFPFLVGIKRYTRP